MKKIVSLLLAVLMVTAFGTTIAFAEDVSTPATLRYTAPNTYVMNIPMEIQVGEATDIAVDNINVADGDRINIYVDGLSANGHAILQHNTDPNVTAEVVITANGAEMTASNTLVGWFSGENDTATDWEINSYIYNQNDNLKAGQYSGTVYFTMQSTSV